MTVSDLSFFKRLTQTALWRLDCKGGSNSYDD